MRQEKPHERAANRDVRVLPAVQPRENRAENRETGAAELDRAAENARNGGRIDA